MQTKNQKQLEKELEASEKKSAEIRKKIQDLKPKDITERVQSFADVLKIAKPTKEELALLNYSGKSDRIKFASKIMRLALGSEVLNEGEKPKANGKDERHYPYFDVSSGFAFFGSSFFVSFAITPSASRLSLKNSKLAVHHGKIFLKEHKDAITM